jgi:pilus assembly protein FimV
LEELNSAAMMEHALSEDMLDSISIIDIAAGLSEEKASADKTLDQNSIGNLDNNDLDFDLGIEAPADEAPIAQEDDLSMQHMDNFDAILKGEVETPVAPSEPEVPVIDFGSIDFDLGDDDPEPIQAKEESEFSHSVGLDWAANDIANIANNSEVESPVVEPATQDSEIEVPVALEDADFDSSMIDSENSVLPSVDMTPPAFDLGSINFDLPESNSEESNQAANNVEELNVSATEFDMGSTGESEAESAEMATKLDLALAYQEIGDKEGARELLEEVKVGGSKEQQKKAAEMLSTLS